MTLALYHAPGACSLAAHICLEEVGAEVDYRRVDLAHGEQRQPDYLKLNPKGRVPLLVTGQGLLSELGAILGWIAATWPEARLSPTDPWGRAQVESFNSYLGSGVHAAAFGALFRPARFSDDPAQHAAIKAKGLAAVQDSFALIEDRLTPGAWIHGDYATSDPYLFVMTRWYARTGENLGRFPAIEAHARRMLERPAVQRALDAEQITFG